VHYRIALFRDLVADVLLGPFSGNKIRTVRVVVRDAEMTLLQICCSGR